MLYMFGISKLLHLQFNVQSQLAWQVLHDRPKPRLCVCRGLGDNAVRNVCGYGIADATLATSDTNR